MEARPKQSCYASQVYRRDFVDASLEEAPSTPGMKYRSASIHLLQITYSVNIGAPSLRHYSPDAPVTLVEPRATTRGSSTERQVTSDASSEPASGSECGTKDWVAAVSLAARREVGALLRALGDGQRVALLKTTCAVGTPVGPLARGAVDDPRVFQYCLGCMGDPISAARELFAALRLADAEVGVCAVVVEGLMEEAEGLAVMNRLRKAATRVVQVDDMS